ncbi:hypothetical protein CPT_Minot_025 [Acinetobacter phage Minot]|nr:hypothetical protein CPT_Minot_025 [Acinetobacter phage Minot]QQO96477.1 hypothetical protein CPT_Mokit_026 [Acinetobacter phage Mokit]
MQTLAEIKQELEQEKAEQFGNLEQRAIESDPLWLLDENGEPISERVESAAKMIIRRQICQVLRKQKSTAEELEFYRKFFKQTIYGVPVELPINNQYLINLQKSDALRILLKEGFVKMKRRRGRTISRSRFNFGWKPCGTYQTYLVIR